MPKKTVLRKRGRVTVDGHTVPVTVFFEKRSTARVSTGKDSVLLRVPARCSEKQLSEYKQWCSRWIKKQWQSSERFRATYMPFDLTKCRKVSTMDKEFCVRISDSDRKMARGAIEDNIISLQFPEGWPEAERSPVGYRMIHDLLVRLYAVSFERRVRTLHQGRFAKRIRSVTLRNMSSRWGSCSQHGELSFSTRLLFAPKSVQDYVILHELCHLDVLDHSDRFWKRVETYDPHYARKEQWLDDHGHLCDIKMRSQGTRYPVNKFP